MRRSIRVATAVMVALAAWSGVSAAPKSAGELDQGWTYEQRVAWYGASQGSRLIPLAWLRALEQPGGGGKFLDASYIERLRYIPEGGVNGLPVGFSVDIQDDRKLLETRLRWRQGQGEREPWVGMNCAACHTTKLRYAGKDYVVDGGATLADFQTLLVSLEDALSQTLSDPARFDRFAREVLYSPPGAKAADTKMNRDVLRQALDLHLRYTRTKAQMNKTTSKYGYGRLDAVGHILNKVVLVANRKDPVGAEPDAPVSYPFLWNVNQHENVQWNGIAPNFKLPARQDLDGGALIRNISEVTGVFADVDTRWNWKGGYRTSADVSNLVAMEQLLGKLSAPKWPSDWPLDQALVSEGAPLFKDKCSSCHQTLDRKNLETRIPLRMSLFKPSERFPGRAPGTDKAMACNAATSRAKTGSLKGAGENYFNVLKPLGREERVATMLTTLTVGQLWAKRSEVAGAALRSVVGLNPPPRVAKPAAAVATAQTRREECEDVEGDTLGYKARPLNGVWATAPYLHNGSVATLYDLLLPPAERKGFYVGSREFDPVRVGYVSAKTSPDDYYLNPFTPSGQPAWGDSNAGHDYENSQFTTRQRQALVEYMKTFGER